jgi:hypothetical protein
MAVDSVGLSGGLALFWDESINVTLLSQGERYLDVTIQEDPNATPWRATFVYGEPRVEKGKRCGIYYEIYAGFGRGRGCSWGTLMNLCGTMNIFWRLLDLNDK